MAVEYVFRPELSAEDKVVYWLFLKNRPVGAVVMKKDEILVYKGVDEVG